MRKVAVGIVVCGVIAVAAPFGGAVSSGALLLLRPASDRPHEHDLPETYRPRHKGHIHLGTGLYVREDEDLVVRGTPALILRRTYLSGHRLANGFGIGTTHEGERHLVGDPEKFQWVALVLPDGGQVRFERVSSGTSFYNAMYEHRATPTEWLGARLGWTGNGWALRRADGTLLVFQGCGSGSAPVCSILRERDSDGHVVHYRRDSDGRLSRIEAEDNRWIAFDYDEGNHIRRVYDQAGREVTYAYDAAGRLSKVNSHDGRESRYEYTDLDELRRIVDRGLTIENTYDSGRVIRQVTHAVGGEEPFTFDFAYQTRGGVVVQADTTRSDGTWTRYTYGPHRYIDSETWGSDGLVPSTFVYERDPVTNVITALTLTCPDRTGRPLRHSSGVPNGNDEWIKWDLRRTNCSWRGQRVRAD